MLDHPLRRRGFTLVELLTVITIIGILAALSVFGITRALASVRQRTTIVEIGELSSALDLIKTKVKDFPPCMGALTSDEVSGQQVTRGDRFDLFTRSMFPRSRIDYSTLKDVISRGTAPYAYRYRNSAGAVSVLDLRMMDQSEAMVFWLGGFPCPVDSAGKLIGPRKLIGFHPNPASPFALDTGANALKNRTASVYEFDDTRLIDTDDDGWLEYVPRGSSGSTMPAPFVYWDAKLYASFPSFTQTTPFHSYPTEGSKAPYNSMTTKQIESWGLAMPYASALSPTKFISWINPNTFQIIAPGEDGMFGKPATAVLRISVFPGGTAYRGSNYSQFGSFDLQEDDNLANFADSPIGSN